SLRHFSWPTRIVLASFSAALPSVCRQRASVALSCACAAAHGTSTVSSASVTAARRACSFPPVTVSYRTPDQTRGSTVFPLRGAADGGAVRPHRAGGPAPSALLDRARRAGFNRRGRGGGRVKRFRVPAF